MITCKECGYTGNRLQWTHFKYNCTGRFTNGKEYQSAYPGAPLVDSTVANKTAVTLKNLTVKYGEKDGLIRWNQYKEKQSYTNSFEHKQKKHGWTITEFDSYNKSRAVTLQNLIKKHGEEKGISKWEEYCDRQRFTKTREYLIEKYGEIVGAEKFIEINKKKGEANDPKVLANKLGVTIDEAVEIIVGRGTYKYTSLLEQEFISSIEKVVELEHTSIKHPFGKWIPNLSKYVVFDIKHKNCIIEFNGDYWHANPSIYIENDLIRGVKAQDLWTKDREKIQFANSLGYRTLVVWESDYVANKTATVESVIKWILSE